MKTFNIKSADIPGRLHTDETDMLLLSKDSTGRGFSKLEFIDRYGECCSIQQSSLATEGAIWFGVNEQNSRMHLTRLQIAQLLPALIHFAQTGDLDTTKVLLPEDQNSLN